VALFLGIAAISATAVASLDALRFQSSLEIWFLEDDPELLVHREFLERFQRNEVALLGVFADDVFKPEVLACIQRLTDTIAQAPFVARVRSLATAESFLDADGDFGIAPLMPSAPTDPADARALRARVMENPLLRGHFVSADATAAAIVIELRPTADSEGKSAKFVKALRGMLSAEDVPGIHFALGGGPPFQEAFQRTSLSDARRFGLSALLLAFGLLVAIFRNLRVAALPMGVVALSTLWTLGAMAWFDFQLTILSLCLLGLVLTVGIADAIHLLSAVRRRLARGAALKVALHESLDALLWPCCLTSLTTAAGMLSLQVSTLQPLREFGCMAAFGVVVAFLLSVTLLPALLLWLPEDSLRGGSPRGDSPLDRLLTSLARPSPRTSHLVLASSALLVVAAIAQLPNLEMGSNPLGYFQEDAPIRRATETLDRELGGSATIEFLIEAPGGGLRAPQTLRDLETLEASLVARPGVSQVTSVLAPLKELRRVLEGKAPGAGALPEESELAAQLHLLLEGANDYPQLVQDDASVGRLSARARYSHSAELVAELPVLDAELEALRAGGGPRVRPTGPVKLIANMETQLLHSQRRSFLLAFAVITAMMFLLTRSFSLGAMAMIPNLVPVLLGLGIMAAVGFSLDPGTVMIASIALGLVVDDTVHFMVRFQRQRSAGQSAQAAVEHTLRAVGRPIVLTSTVLLGGFGVLALSSFNPNVHFGLISALVVVLALVADLVMLPAALRIFEPGG